MSTSAWRSAATLAGLSLFLPKKTQTSGARERKRQSAVPARDPAAITTAGKKKSIENLIFVQFILNLGAVAERL